jgi:hypothetical protein
MLSAIKAACEIDICWQFNYCHYDGKRRSVECDTKF